MSTCTVRGPLVLALALAAATAACATDSPVGNATRETLPNGAVLVRYPDLPAIDSVGPEVTEVQMDLKFGNLEGDDPNSIFGDIRGVQASSDGTIYVVDNQALEVRVFSPAGEYLRMIVRRGEGPGEILRSNGIILSGDTLLWVNETRQYAIIGVDPDGNELRRFTKPVWIRGYIWDGVFDQLGRYWKEASHTDEDMDERRDQAAGLFNEQYRSYYKSYDLSTGGVDSIYLGEGAYREYIVVRGGTTYYFPIPFDASEITVVHPSGGFWHVNTASYRVTRTGDSGDTVVVIEAALSAPPVTDEDRLAYVQEHVEYAPDERRGIEAAAALAPDVKPMLGGLFVDDEGRLWVERITPSDVPPFHDLFSEDGNYLGSVRLGFQPAPGVRLWVQHGNIYTWVVDELDVPYVVRAPLVVSPATPHAAPAYHVFEPPLGATTPVSQPQSARQPLLHDRRHVQIVPSRLVRRSRTTGGEGHPVARRHPPLRYGVDLGFLAAQLVAHDVPE